MKKILLIVLTMFFIFSTAQAQELENATVVDTTGTDYFFYWYVGTIGKQIAVDSAGKVHMTYTKTWVTESDTGYQVMYTNLTDGVKIPVPSQDTADVVQPAVSFIGGGTNGNPVYVMYGVGSRAYSYSTAKHMQAVAAVEGDQLLPKGTQTDQFYWGPADYSNPYAMEVGSNGMVHVLFTNPMGDPVLYWNFDGTNFSDVASLTFNYGYDNPYQGIPGQHRMNAVEGSDLAISSDGLEVAVVSLHSFNQIWIHKGKYGGLSWESDFATALDNGDLIPLFDTTQAVQWLPDLYNANKARPYSDAQVVYDADDKLVVAYTATYRSHWLDTTSSVSGWMKTHAGWPGDSTGLFFDGSEKAKPQVIAWTETGATHNVVAEAMYPLAGETYEWFNYGTIDSSMGGFGNAFVDGIIGNIELIANNNAAEGEPKFILLMEQMATPAVALKDTAWDYLAETYYAYSNDIFSVYSNDGATWSGLKNLSMTPNLDENDVSAVVADGKLHLMWTSDNFGGRDGLLMFTDDYENKFASWTSGGKHSSYPIRLAPEDQCYIMYKALPLDKITDVKENIIPTGYEISQNYPNPFNPTTSIAYTLPVKSEVAIKVYNSIGQLVTTLVNGVVEQGKHRVDWNASNVSSGVYFYKIEAGEFTSTKKMILLK